MVFSIETVITAGHIIFSCKLIQVGQETSHSKFSKPLVGNLISMCRSDTDTLNSTFLKSKRIQINFSYPSLKCLIYKRWPQF